MRPFLLLSSRAEDEAADGEYEALLACTGLQPRELHRVRIEAAPLPPIDLHDYAGVLVGGGPFNCSDPDDVKSPVQRRVETEIQSLLDSVVDRDVPFFGACYGIGTLGRHEGAVIDRTHAEPVGVTTVTLTPAGVRDPLLAGVPPRFSAFVGHKEACRSLPSSAVLLAGSAACPVQMFRVKTNLYATQFHPELDVAGILTRVRVYQHSGYFPASEAEQLARSLQSAVVTEPQRILANFVARYA